MSSHFGYGRNQSGSILWGVCSARNAIAWIIFPHVTNVANILSVHSIPAGTFLVRTFFGCRGTDSSVSEKLRH